MKSVIRLSKEFLLAGALVGGWFTASAELIMYHGFPRDASSEYTMGFVDGGGVFQPSGVGSMMLTGDSPATSLTLPTCFSGSAKIKPQKGGDDDSAMFVSDVASGRFPGTAEGAKLAKLADNCQARKGSLYFRLLLKADQGVIDNLGAADVDVPKTGNSQSCGILWTVPDYYVGCAENSNMRLNAGLNLSPKDNIANKGKIVLNFVRGFLVSLFKSADESVSIKLFLWGSDTPNTSSCKTITLVDNVTADETYVCLVRIDIDAAANGAEAVYAMAQPVSSYDSAADLVGNKFFNVVSANLIGGEGSSSLHANVVFQGANKNLGTMRFDELCLTTAADAAVVSDKAGQDLGVVIAYDGFPCGTGAYPESETDVESMKSLSSSLCAGFADRTWGMNMLKSTPKIFGAGAGLSLPEIYAEKGVVVTDGTAIGFNRSTTQSLSMYRAFTDGLLNLSEGKTLNMRVLMSVTSGALTSLAKGTDTTGTLLEGEAGQKKKVNYLGAGIDILKTGEVAKVEFNDSAAPCLCQRDNSCLFTFVKGSDGNVGLYLNLRTHAADTPSAYKLAEVDSAVGGTYLCFATIEVGTGTAGKERIRAFGVNVKDVKDRYVMNWVPSDAGKDSAIEYELIGQDAYPTHLVVGGDSCADRFAFDEFALSFGDWYPLVWAKYPRRGLVLLLK